MTDFGFSITRLTLTGSGVPDAEVRLTEGLNVICGPSDTGKTFIAQCIDFAFGASSVPEAIPEAAAYDTVHLGLRLHESGAESTIQRSLRGGEVLLRVEGEDDHILAARHNPNSEDTVSHYLLSLSGLSGKIVRTNQRGTTRTLSFRDLARLVVVDEESIISKASPVLTGQYTTRTVESNVFRLLLTGVDDSSVVEGNERRLVRSRQEAKVEVVEQLRTEVENQIVERRIDGSVAELREQLARVETLFASASEQLTAEQATLSALDQRRQGAWVTVRRVDSRLNVFSELQDRFTLLEKQYTSDLRRLESIAEAGIRLGQLHEARCPVCGALAEHHDAEHQNPNASPDQVAIACEAEAAKIRVLLVDLQSTRTTNATEVESLRQQRRAVQFELDGSIKEIQESLRPRIQEALTRFRESQASRDGLRTAIELLDRRASFERMISALEAPAASVASQSPSAEVRSSEAEDFSQEAEGVLRSWQFPDLGRVTFSETAQDLVISGRPRASHGKGVRAVTHAAFNVAILNYCRSRSKPHPGFVLLDSPLVVYREPDPGEDRFSQDVKGAFYRSLAKYKGSQVVILENEEPPAELETSANIIKFTGTNRGRRGFIPLNDATSASE
jgi:hypothetical protein